jgi:ADP-ribose pyrophosphatase YjhB (NUDIX family)
LHTEPPPAEFVTSVRALVLRNDEVLLVRDPTGYHILPGGRREAGETYHETVVRELLEETGWQIEIGRLLGFKHFYRLTPQPAEIVYPHPDFAQIVYLATPVSYRPEAREQAGYELGSEFVPLIGLDQDQITWSERLFLQAARTSGKYN